MANIWDGRILIWEPDRKEYLKTVWQDGWVEYLPNKRGFEVHMIDDRPYLREGRSTYDQRKVFLTLGRYIYRMYKKPEFGRFFHVFFDPKILFKYDPIRANFMRKIDWRIPEV